jgi:hypothetical protein
MFIVALPLSPFIQAAPFGSLERFDVGLVDFAPENSARKTPRDWHAQPSIPSLSFEN